MGDVKQWFSKLNYNPLDFRALTFKKDKIKIAESTAYTKYSTITLTRMFKYVCLSLWYSAMMETTDSKKH